MRTMICECLPNYIGDATVACAQSKNIFINIQNFFYPIKIPLDSNAIFSFFSPVAHQVKTSCDSDSECPSNLACLNRRCESPCTIRPCPSSAECHVENHRYVCACPSGLLGDPFVGCTKGKHPPKHKKTNLFHKISSGSKNIDNLAQISPQLFNFFFFLFPSDVLPSPECTSNSDCPANLGCINQRCVNPCANNRCGSSANCLTIDHHPTCHCPEGYAGDPQIQCFRRK